MANPMPRPAWLDDIRSQFPGSSRGIFFQSSAHALMPAGARQAVVRYLEDCIETGGSPSTMADTLKRVREKYARLIHAEPDEIAIVKNVSEGLNAIVTAIPWQPGDNAVLCRTIEHPNAIYALYNMRDRYGIEVRCVAPTPGQAVSVDAIREAIDANTRLVIASTVAYTTGARTDLDALAGVCRSRRVCLLVDGAQSIGALTLDVSVTPLDAVAVGASKYLCGPSGLGFLYVRRATAERMQPGSLARYGVDLGDAHEGEQGGEAYNLMPAARRFEGGSYNYAGINATEVALDLLTGVGIPAIEAHVSALGRRMFDGLAAIGLPLVSAAASGDDPANDLASDRFDDRANDRPPHAPSHIVVAGRIPADPETGSLLQRLHDHLAENGIKTSLRQGRLRFSFHFYNTAGEVDQVLALTRAFMAVRRA